jgi:hypothetical protein
MNNDFEGKNLIAPAPGVKCYQSSDEYKTLLPHQVRELMLDSDPDWKKIPQKHFMGETLSEKGMDEFTGIRFMNEPDQSGYRTTTKDGLLTVHYVVADNGKRVKIVFQGAEDVWLQNGHKNISYIFLDGEPAMGETRVLDHWNRYNMLVSEEDINRHFSDMFKKTKPFFLSLSQVCRDIPVPISFR